MVYLSCLLVFAGFSTSRLVISLGVIGLIAGGLLSGDFRQTFATYLKRPAYYINTLFFLVILLSGINSADRHQWLTFLQIKIPFLLLPIAFCGYSFFDRAFLNKLLLLFTACMFVSATCVMINYALHYEDINLHILSGSVIPVPFSHIRYTLLLVFTFFALLWLWEQRIIAQRTILLAFAFFFFVVIHVLSSRSGWLALYAGLLFYFTVYIYRTRRYIIGSLMLVAIISIPILLYHLIPSFHNKVAYMKYSFEEYRAGHLDDMSDAMRINSWIVGVDIIRRHPLTGVGVGSLVTESKETSRRLFPSVKKDEDRKMPHNEFIWIWAATGIFGLLAYCTAFFFPLISSLKHRHWLFAMLYVIFFTSFLSEPSIEEQIGSVFYLVFLLIFLTHFNYRAEVNE